MSRGNLLRHCISRAGKRLGRQRGQGDVFDGRSQGYMAQATGYELPTLRSYGLSRPQFPSSSSTYRQTVSWRPYLSILCSVFLTRTSKRDDATSQEESSYSSQVTVYLCSLLPGVVVHVDLNTPHRRVVRPPRRIEPDSGTRRGGRGQPRLRSVPRGGGHALHHGAAGTLQVQVHLRQ